MGMKDSTLCLLYLVKYLELAFLFAWTGLIAASGVYYIGLITDRDSGSGDSLNIMATMACIILAVFNLFYNNLFINLRFKSKMKSVTLGLCCFDAINYCICYCFLVNLTSLIGAELTTRGSSKIFGLLICHPTQVECWWHVIVFRSFSYWIGVLVAILI